MERCRSRVKQSSCLLFQSCSQVTCLSSRKTRVSRNQKLILAVGSDETERDNLDYDINVDGRYHFQTLFQRKHMAAIKSVTQRNKFATDWGLEEEQEPPLLQITPALDIIRTRPLAQEMLRTVNIQGNQRDCMSC